MRLPLVLALIMATATAALAGPKLAVSPSRHDFGTILEGAPAEVPFTLKNVGDAPLTIERVRTSCGCTASALAKSHLAPGESTTLTISYDTRNRPGAFTKEATLMSDDPVSPETKATIVGVVQPPPRPNALMTPNPVRMKGAQVGRETAVTFTLANSGDAPLLVERMTLLDGQRNRVEEYLSEGPLRLKPKEKRLIRVTIVPVRPEPFRFFVELSTNNPLNPLAYLTLFGDAAP